MAKIVTITNPLTGQPAQVDQLDHTAQQIDDGLNIARGVSNQNLLDNWYFGNPVNQRGQTEYTVSGYTFDRWLLNQWNTTSVACSIVTKGLRVRGEASSSCSTVIKQFVEGIKAGCQVTASVLVTDFTVGSAVHLFIRTNSGVKLANVRFSKPGLYSVTTTLPDDFDGNLMIDIGQGGSEGGNGNTDFTVLATKLELGTQQTLAHQDANGNWVLNEIPNYGEQLARCQRALYRDGGSDYTSVGYGLAETGKTAYFLVKLPVPMRVRPSVTYAGNWTVWDGVTGRAIESMAVNEGATNPKDCSFVNIKVNITGSDLTIGKMYQLCVRNDKSAYIEFIC